MPTLAICTPIHDKPEPEFVQSILDLKTALDAANSTSEKAGQGTLLNYQILQVPRQDLVVARNSLTAKALELGADLILWADADATFSPSAVLRLLSLKLPIVGGLAFSRRFPFMPTLLRRHARSRAIDTPGASLGFMYDFPPNDRVEVDATGGHFLLVQRKVFEAIPAGTWWNRIGDLSEDVSFCQRARQAGFKVYVDTGCRVGHMAQVCVDADFAVAARGSVRHNEWIPEGLRVSTGAGADDDEPGTDESARATIVIPTFNTPSRFLHAAIASALEQSVPVEVIVVDDGSSDLDQVPGVAEGLVRLIKHGKNKGISEAMNTGFRESKTDWIAWLSADDLFHPSKVERCLQAALTLDVRAVFHGYGCLIDGAGEWTVPRPPPWSDMETQQKALAAGCWVNGSTTMIHRSVFQKVGLYDVSYRYSQDWEMWNRIAREFFWYYLPDNLGMRRETMGNLTQRINRDGEKWKIKTTEDNRIRRTYGPDRDEFASDGRESTR